MSELTEQWQTRLDTDFPVGFTATWGAWPGRRVGQRQPGLPGAVGLGDWPGRASTPSVKFWVYGADKGFEGLRMLSYAETQAKPVLLVRVTFDNVARAMLLEQCWCVPG